MTNYERLNPSTISEQLQAALTAHFDRPVRVEGVLTDWRSTPKFGHGKITAESDPNAHLPISMQMWRAGGGKAHLTKGLRVTVIGTIEWHHTFGLRLMATQIRTSGVSNRHQSVLDLRERLGRQADSPQKRFRVTQPSRVAILAPHGGDAALTDARAVLKALPDDVHLFTHRIPMGGPAATTEIAKALLSLSRSADLILIVRGGGSTTDLTVWDDAKVVERISDCRVPIVVGVGHSINPTAAGLAAHHHAITPTAAAQWVCNLYPVVSRPQVQIPVPPRQQVVSKPVPVQTILGSGAAQTRNRQRRIAGRILAALAILAVFVLVVLLAAAL